MSDEAVHDPQTVRLGKKAYRHDPRTLHFGSYLVPDQLPHPPATYDVAAAPMDTWGMLGNDVLGDCTCAAAAHMRQAWRWANGSPVPDVATLQKAAETAYWQTGSQDDGRQMIDVLRYWQHHGIAGGTIGAYVRVDPTNELHMKLATWLFGGVYLGVQLPVTAQREQTWRAHASRTGDAMPGSWGGHAVNVRAYLNHVEVVTWGASKGCTWGFVREYADEAWAIISPDWLTKGTTPAGFDMAALSDDLQKIQS